MSEQLPTKEELADAFYEAAYDGVHRHPDWERIAEVAIAHGAKVRDGEAPKPPPAMQVSGGGPSFDRGVVLGTVAIAAIMLVLMAWANAGACQ